MNTNNQTELTTTNKGERQEDIDAVFRRIFNTLDGVIALKYLQEDYMNRDAFDPNSIRKTDNTLGKQALVKKALSFLEDKSRLTRVQTVKINQKGNYNNASTK